MLTSDLLYTFFRPTKSTANERAREREREWCLGCGSVGKEAKMYM